MNEIESQIKRLLLLEMDQSKHIRPKDWACIIRVWFGEELYDICKVDPVNLATVYYCLMEIYCGSQFIK